MISFLDVHIPSKLILKDKIKYPIIWGIFI